MPFYVTVTRQGAHKPSGWLGPYARRASALTDAAGLKAPGLRVGVTKTRPVGLSGSLSPRSNPLPAIATAGRAALKHPAVREFIVTTVLPMVSRSVQGGITAFRKASRAEQVKALRKIARFMPQPHGSILKRLLKNDKAAASIARALSSKESVSAMKAVARSAEVAAAARF
mgnify:CR=1 FL=1